MRKKIFIYLKAGIVFAIVLTAIFLLSFLFLAGMIRLGLLGLSLMGITSPIKWSWKIAFGVYLFGIAAQYIIRKIRKIILDK